jgi:hypothetical protein
MRWGGLGSKIVFTKPQIQKNVMRRKSRLLLAISRLARTGFVTEESNTILERLLILS